MPIKFEQSADAKYLIFVKEGEDRKLITTIEGNCTMAECFNFINMYPLEEISQANERLIPISTDIFEYEVKVKIRGFNAAVAGQKMPEWLEFFSDQFGGTMKFIDGYTFHIMKHVLLTHTGENPEIW